MTQSKVGNVLEARAFPLPSQFGFRCFHHLTIGGIPSIGGPHIEMLSSREGFKKGTQWNSPMFWETPASSERTAARTIGPALARQKHYARQRKLHGGLLQLGVLFGGVPL